MKLFKNVYFLYTIIVGLIVILANQWSVMSDMVETYNDYQDGIAATYIPKPKDLDVEAPSNLHLEGVYCINQIGLFEYVVFKPNFRGTVYAPSYGGKSNYLDFRYVIQQERREVDVEFFEGVLRDGMKLPAKMKDIFKVLSWDPEGKITMMVGWHGVLSNNCKYTKLVEDILHNYPNDWKKLLLELTSKQLNAVQGTLESFSNKNGIQETPTTK